MYFAKIEPASAALTLLLVLGPQLSATAAGGAGGGRLWPVTIAPSLSSSFGEYREGHFHGGIDIRTLGKEGLPCRAVGDGFVSRMRASARGYGKAIYIELDTGETVVYAHLSEFAPDMEAFLYREQEKAERYQVDLAIGRGRFPVEGGQIVGYTGSTGARAPHLHFEVRDPQGRPINPLTHGWEVRDKVFPRFERILWLPLESGSRINGRCLPLELPLHTTGEHIYAAAETVSVSGPVGLAALVIDGMSGSPGKLSPYIVELTVDGSVLSRLEMERFSYARAREVELAYEMERVRERGDPYLLLFEREEGGSFQASYLNGGVIEVGQGGELEVGVIGGRRGEPVVHTALVRAMDKSGNVGIALVPFRREVGGQASASSSDGVGRNEVEEPSCFFLYRDFFSVKRSCLIEESVERVALLALGEALRDDPGPVGESVVGGGAYTVSCEKAPGGRFFLDIREGGKTRRIYLLAARNGEGFSIPDLGIAIETGNSLYSNSFLVLAREETGEVGMGIRAELEPVSDPIFFGPLSLPLRSSVIVHFATGERLGGTEAIYSYDRKKEEWNFCPTLLRGDTLSVRLKAPGVYRAFRDRLAPRIAEPGVRWRPSYGTGEERPEIAVSVEDLGSGVDDEKTWAYLDGKKLIGRWDAFAKKMFVIVQDKNIMGMHELKVVSADRSGNTSLLQTNIDFSSGKLSREGGASDGR